MQIYVMKIEKKKDTITFEFPLESPRYNPYMEDNEQHGNYPVFTCLIVRHDGYDEMGFANTIDMNYADKEDQFSDIIVQWDGEEKEFIEKCRELEFGLQII